MLGPFINGNEVHRRQFIVTRLKPSAGWDSLPLPDGFFLVHHPEAFVTRREGTYTIGIELPGGGGRFARIAWPYLEVDVGGMLGVFYDRERLEASSSPALLYDNRADPVVPPLPRNSINWFPDGPIPRTRRLIRDQRLHLPTMTAEAIDRIITPLGSFEAARRGLAEALTEAVRGLPRSSRIFLALTAGKDSRTLASALAAAGIAFETYTQTYPSIAPADITIAQAISRHLGVRHHLISPSGHSREVLNAWEHHSCHAVHDADNAFFPADQYGFVRSGDVLVRGGCFEVGRRFYDWALSGLGFPEACGQEIARRFEAAPDRIPALDRWLEWRRANDCGLDLMDAFYLDQRVGGWLAAIEQGLDMLPAVSLHPASSMASFRALMTPPVGERLSGKLQVETIRALAPGLLKWPFNPQPLTLRSVMQRAKRRLLARAA